MTVQVSQFEQEKNKDRLIRGLERAKKIMPSASDPKYSTSVLKESSGYDIDEPIIGLTPSFEDNYDAMPNLSESASKLPPEILESMLGTSSISTSMTGNNVSILDELPVETIIPEKKITPQRRSQNRTITEQVYTQPVSSQPVQANIDYSLIKMIVEDVVKKNMAAMKKSIISESKNIVENDNLNILKIGDTFQFLTKDGNLFEATLKFKKNINKKGT